MPMGKPRKETIKTRKGTLPSEIPLKKKTVDKKIPIIKDKEKVADKITEKEITQLPAIQALGTAIQEVTGKLEGYDAQIKETDVKISALAEAVGILNDEFTKFMHTLQNKFSSPEKIPGKDSPDINAGAPRENTAPPGTTIVASTKVGVDKPPLSTETPPPSTQDKLLTWANLLAQLAGVGSGGGSGGGGGGHTLGTTDLLRLVLELQNSAEDRALKRQEVAINSMVNVVKLVMGKKPLPSLEAGSSKEPTITSKGHLE